VLVLAAQNAVDYKYLGVASSGSTLFRQIGGSIGVAAFGAIFANELLDNLGSRLPAGVHLPAAAEPAALKQLPPAVHTVYVTALTDALHPVFLAAAGAAVLAFLLTWLLPELTLKTTARAPDVGEGFHAARDDNALREIERALSLLAGREQRWDLYVRLAARAGVDLAPPELWLLARLGERAPLTEPQLAEQLQRDGRPIGEALEQLRQHSLVDGRDDGTIALTTRGLDQYERLVAAKCAGLRELLEGWNPDQQPELQRLVARLGRELVSEIPTPVPATA
jgi:DNA-binding MarR family transcriptional regulator